MKPASKSHKYMDLFTQLVLVIGRVTPNHVQLLGTGFLVSNDGKIATTRHVVGNFDKNLVVLAPHVRRIDEYQDMTDARCTHVSASIAEMDPIRDLAILKADVNLPGIIPPLSSFDGVNVGEEVGIFGFPQCVQGRRALTFQKAELGCKVLLESNNIKSKYAVINTQARPGQSGSLVFLPRTNSICGVLVGAWAPNINGGGISLGGVNPHELHQTTHCVSAEYVRAML